MHDHRIDTADLPWGPTSTPGVEQQQLAPGELGSHSVAVVRLAPGLSLPTTPDRATEAVVLDGDWQLPQGPLGPGGYARWSATTGCENHTEHGCRLFVRTAPFDDQDTAVVHASAAPEFWLPGQGQLRVRPLHSFGTEHSALVQWPAGERFVPHRHWGGEEIFVLSGTFEDEHGRYPQGTWLLSPHLSSHHPFVREETVIFVRTGHVLSMASAS